MGFMYPRATIVDSGAIVKVGFLWTAVIFQQNRFFYSLDLLAQGRSLVRWVILLYALSDTMPMKSDVEAMRNGNVAAP